jgi:hypothetical protein
LKLEFYLLVVAEKHMSNKTSYTSSNMNPYFINPVPPTKLSLKPILNDIINKHGIEERLSACSNNQKYPLTNKLLSLTSFPSE